MKVILLKNVVKVGKKDAVVEVPDGFARNALLPKRLAIEATPEVVKRHESSIRAKMQMAQVDKELVRKAYESIDGKVFALSIAHNEQGVLFKKVTIDDIVRTISDQSKIVIDKDALVIENLPIKRVGKYKIYAKDAPQYIFFVEVQ